MTDERKKSLVMRILLLTFVPIFVCIIGFGIYAVQITSTAEMNIHAMRQSVIATQMFVQKNDGQWPSSWDDLKNITPEELDLNWASKHVRFDFSADPNELAAQTAQTWETFTGIVPNEPLLQRLRQ